MLQLPDPRWHSNLVAFQEWWPASSSPCS
jgi:hypothetical protein